VPTPTFSVIMPAFNAAATIDAAMASVFAQTRQDFELVVVDDGSVDETSAHVTGLLGDPRVRLVQQENMGLAAARNTGIRESRGRYLSLLDSDDMWMPGYLEAMERALEADPGAGFAYTDAWALDDDTRRIRRKTAMANQRPPDPPPPDAGRLLAELLERNFVFVAATIPRHVLDEVGSFDARLRSSEDYELWLRIAAHGRHATRPPGLHAIYRLRSTSLSHDEEGMFASLGAVFRTVVEEHPVSEDIRSRARARLRDIERRQAVLQGGRPFAARRLVTRRALGRVQRRMLDRRLWYGTPPAEVAAAFPDLGRV